MPITDDIKKTLTDPTPLYALAGAGDLAYEKLREVPGKVEALAADRKGTQEKATARLAEAQARLVEAQSKVTDTVTALPADLRTLQEKAQTFALQQVGRAVELAVKAKETYDGLAERGKVAVDRGRGAEAGAAEAVAERVDAEEAGGELVEGELVEEAVAGDEAPAAAPKRGRSRKSAE
ncbi:hypothetical protein [Kitasatospora sp. NPDC057541]|uniref:hypothetical protein n=1 Tax=unclassified Kitasatospora TaxID=2633591 RepID=UPI0036D0EF11